MDPQRHAELSARRRGGQPEDYYDLHALMDATKELCSDNRHRVLHTLWGIRRVAIPLFGTTVSLGSRLAPVKSKDVLEFDHVLADYRNRFIPTLSDFVAAFSAEAMGDWRLDADSQRRRFREIHRPFRNHDRAMELLLSPYALTGHVCSLLFTHNTWFLNEVLPRVAGVPRHALNEGIPPQEVFEPLLFRPWMDNGMSLPPSYPRTGAASPSAQASQPAQQAPQQTSSQATLAQPAYGESASCS